MTSINKQPLPDELSHCILGETSTLFTVAQLSENLAALNRLLEQSGSSVDIFSRQLDPRIFDQRNVTEALRNLVVVNRRARVRILVKEPQLMINQGHQMLELMRRLSSYIDIRKTHEQYAQSGRMFVIADRQAYLYKESDERYEGLVSFYDPAQSREWLNFFNEAWEHSQAITDFRRLHI